MVACISATAFFISSVNSTVFPLGCFSILRITAGFPLSDPSPRFNVGPNFTSATCFKRIGALLALLIITVFPISSKEVASALAMFLINTSEP